MKLLDFLSPTKILILIWIVLVLLVPVFYVYFEPERTNYLPGEKQTYLVKTKMYPGSFQEYAFHAEGRIDLFWGILERNYIQNLMGPIVLLVYYLLASIINWIFKRVRNQSEFSRK